MNPIVAKLQKRATDKATGKLKWGAVSRIAERLDVSETTVRNWFRGEDDNGVAFSPGKATCERIALALGDQTDWMRSKKMGPRGPWKKVGALAK